jgi:DNA-binding transcriptional LysR family regulator
MSDPDFNLLITLDVLLAEGNVARAARRLHLSPSAMSRALARLRETMGDPLLVRAGRGLVPTPRAVELREQVGQLVQAAREVLRPAEGLDLKQLSRSFVIRARDGFVENFGASLLARLAADAPGVRLRFLPKADKENTPLRDGSVDLDIAVVGTSAGPELHTRALFQDRFVGVARAGHALSKGKITAARYAASQHVAVARREGKVGVIDEALSALGHERNVTTSVGEFSSALALARATDLVATVPERHTAYLREEMFTFALPFPLAEITVSMMWHPRLHADPAHRWLRGCLVEVCGNGMPRSQNFG